MALQWTHRRRPFRPSGRLRGAPPALEAARCDTPREERAACNAVIEQCSKCEQPSTTTAMASDRFHKWVLRVCILSFVPLSLFWSVCAIFSLLCEIKIHECIYVKLQCHAFSDVRQQIWQFNFSFMTSEFRHFLWNACLLSAITYFAWCLLYIIIAKPFIYMNAKWFKKLMIALLKTNMIKILNSYFLYIRWINLNKKLDRLYSLNQAIQVYD